MQVPCSRRHKKSHRANAKWQYRVVSGALAFAHPRHSAHRHFIHHLHHVLHLFKLF